LPSKKSREKIKEKGRGVHSTVERKSKDET